VVGGDNANALLSRGSQKISTDYHVRIDVNRIWLEHSKNPIGLSFERKGPDVSQRLVLNHSVASEPVNGNCAQVVNLGEGAMSFAIGGCNNVHLVTGPN
jgi:hypothetical protein